MKQVWKFQVDGPKVRLYMPKDAIILCVHNQRESICLWAEVSPGNKVEERVIEVFGTGHDMPEIAEGIGLEREYLGTAILDGGSLIFHVYERIS